MILIASHANDLHAAVVLAALPQAVLLDTAGFPQHVGLGIHGDSQDWRAELAIDGKRVDLTETRVVWWRRPLPFALDASLSNPDDRAFAYGECQAAISGLLSCLDPLWINDPDRDTIAARKAFQLKLAGTLGLRTPRTCITNDPEQAGAFIEAEGELGTIYKAFAATEQAWRETRLLRAGEMAMLPSVRFAPVIFQEYIPAQADLRITVIGEELFAAEIRSPETAYQYDFRMVMESAEISPHRLPAQVQDRLRALMSALGLVYGAIDMRLTPQGEYVFLEINPAGQWLFIEERTSQPITQALADLMSKHDT